MNGVIGVGLAVGLAWELAREHRNRPTRSLAPHPADQDETPDLASIDSSVQDTAKQVEPLRLAFFTWNVDAQSPEALRTGQPSNQSLMWDFLSSLHRPDMIHIGLQETIELSNKKLELETKLFATQHRPVSHAYRRWRDYLTDAVDDYATYRKQERWVLVGEEKLVGLYSLVFARVSVAARVENRHFTRVKLGNKGSLAFRFTIGGASFCLLNNHLAAGQGKGDQRRRDMEEILRTARFPRVKHAARGTFECDMDGTRVLDHRFVFFAGDTNSRLEGTSRSDALTTLSSPTPDLSSLLARDELTREMTASHNSSLVAFREQHITFQPTYKYGHGTSTYDSSWKQRVPAWCDRVLWRARGDTVRGTGYNTLEPDISDHRLVAASFACDIIPVNQDKLDKH